MKQIWTEKVKKNQIDYNNHLRDYLYISIFNNGFEKFLEETAKVPNVNTKVVESHIAYLDQAELNDELVVYLSILDYNENEVHAWLVMENSMGDKIATLEELVKVNKDLNISSSLDVNKKYINSNNDYPEEVGKKIKIKRKK